MPNFTAGGILKASRQRAIHDGRLLAVNESLIIPAGTLFVSTNVIRLFRVDAAKINPVRVLADISGNLDGHATPASRTLAGTLGYLRSANRAGTNLSFTYDTTTPLTLTTTPATEDPDFILTAAAEAKPGSSASLVFGTAGAAGLLSSGGSGVFSQIAAGVGNASRGHVTTAASNVALQQINYDANVMDVAITMTANSSTATDRDIIVSVTLEYFGLSNQPTPRWLPYVYDSRYSLTTQLSS